MAKQSRQKRRSISRRSGQAAIDDPVMIDRFLGLPRGSFDHIPLYAQYEAMRAISKVRHLEEAALFRPGVYYICLMDLTASTDALALLGTDLSRRRVETFITAAISALGDADLHSYAQFLKEIGDAVLILFSSFDDVMAWWYKANRWFDDANRDWKRTRAVPARLFPAFRIRAKTALHVGEVSYIEKKNPLCLAVNQVFKIEKRFAPGEIGCTESVRLAAFDLLKSMQIDATKIGRTKLPGAPGPTTLWKLDPPRYSQWSLRRDDRPA